MMSDFVRNSNEIDKDIKKVRNKGKSIQKTFLIIDVVAAVLIIFVYALLYYLFPKIYKSGGDITFILFAIELFEPILNAIFSLILVASAFYLTR